MSIKVLYITSSSIEAEALKKIKGIMHISGSYCFGNMDISLLISGIGTVETLWSMKQWITDNGKPDLAINGGIAGSYKPEFGIGDVVMPVSDCFADAGIEEGDNFLTLSEAGLSGADEFPYKNGYLLTDSRFSIQMRNLLKPVRAITVNTATGSESTRKKLLTKFNPDIETMEGAAFFYLCAREKIPFLSLRAISNIVEPRDKSKWNIDVAIEKLSEKLSEVLIRLD